MQNWCAAGAAANGVPSGRLAGMGHESRHFLPSARRQSRQYHLPAVAQGTGWQLGVGWAAVERGQHA